MPTKPLVQPELWASNALYTTGPFVGSQSKVVPGAAVAAEGHRPGANFPTAAEHENSQQNRLTALARWLFLGTFNPDPDAHVVETDTAGRAGLHALTVNDTVDETAVNITGVNTLVPTVYVTCTTGATVYQADIGNSAGTCFAAPIGTGAGQGLSVTMTNSPAGARAVYVLTNAATAADAIVVDHVGTGRALNLTSSGLATTVSRISGGTVRALIVESGTAGGANGISVSTLNTTGVAIDAFLAGGAGPAARALRATANTNADAIEAIAGNGFGLRASASGAAGTAIFLPGKAGDPTTAVTGKIDHNTTTGTIVVGDGPDLAFRDFRTSRGGFLIAFAGPVNATPTVGVFNTILTATASAGNAAKRSGRTAWVHFVWSDARCLVAPPPTRSLDVNIYEGANLLVSRVGVGTGDTAGFTYDQPTANWQRGGCLSVRWTSVAGAATFTVETASTGGAIRIRDAYLIVEGLY